MAEQQVAPTPAALAAATQTHCPAELLGRECPWGAQDCIDRADAAGLLVACWQAVLTERAALAE